MGLERRAGIVTGDQWRSNIAQRVLRVEQRRPDVEDEGSFADPPRTLTWTIPAPYARLWPGWEAPIEVWVGVVVLRCQGTTTSDTTVDICVNGTSGATLTLPAGETRVEAVAAVTVPRGSELGPEITGVGTALDGLSIQMRVTP